MTEDEFKFLADRLDFGTQCLVQKNRIATEPDEFKDAAKILAAENATELLIERLKADPQEIWLILLRATQGGVPFGEDYPEVISEEHLQTLTRAWSAWFENNPSGIKR